MAGHNHIYYRSRPINRTGADNVNGTIWTIPNAAGLKFNDLINASKLYVYKNQQPNLPMFARIEFTATENIHRAYTVSATGEVVLFDNFTITR